MIINTQVSRARLGNLGYNPATRAEEAPVTITNYVIAICGVSGGVYDGWLGVEPVGNAKWVWLETFLLSASQHFSINIIEMITA